jgi:predicted nuclease of predicted toxin-antitoxin system
MTVRLFADECVARTIVERLRREGYDVVEAAEVCPTVDDDEVLQWAHRDLRVLLTADKDFGELVVRLGHQTLGLVNIALGDLAVATRANIVAARLTELGDRVIGNIVTIEPGRVRIRPLPALGS